MEENNQEVNGKSLDNPRHEAFCRLYASDREFFGNGVQSYIAAYDIDITQKGAYNSAKSSAYDLLTKPYILRRIDELFEAHGLNNIFVDKQLEKLIVQDADKNAKMKAIQEYNKLKSRIKEKVELTQTEEPWEEYVKRREEELKEMK